MSAEQITQLITVELAAVVVAMLLFGRWIISFVQRNIEENASARKELETELRDQIAKLEARNKELDQRLQVCEQKWDDWLATQAGK